MEHRYSDRLTADLNIVIYKQNLLVAMGVVKNIGSEGVFVETGFNEMTLNQPLEIEFLAGDKTAKNNRLKAVVVHRTDSGFGAEIEDVAERIKLASLLHSSHPDRKRAERSSVYRPASASAPGYATL
jgi:predicted RNA-binding protein (virulence factor B family)